MKDIGTAFSTPFKDPEWVGKFTIGALVTLLCITGLGIFVLAGYFIELTARVMRREQYPLPEWKDLGIKFVVGFKYVLVLLAYLLPLILLALPLAALAILAALSNSGGIFGLILSVYLFGFVLIAVPYGIFLSLLTPIIAYRFAEHGRMSDALDVGGIFRTFTKNWESTVVVTLLVAGVQSLAGIGVLLFIVGILFTLFYGYAVSAFLHGLLYLHNTETEQKGL
jgi:hypothetical protein